MHNELTKKDIEKMQEELNYRADKLRTELLEEVKRCREFGDLSENFEYKEAKRARNRNESRIRYLQNMIKTAHIIEDTSTEDTVGLYDRVGLYMEDCDEIEYYKIVTTVRIDPLSGLVSRDSPFGKAILGKKVGDRVKIDANETYSYYAVIRSIEKGEDDGSVGLTQY